MTTHNAINTDTIQFLRITNNLTDVSNKTSSFNNISPNISKGDLTVFNGLNNVRLPVGIDGYVLTADSTQVSGIKWAAAGSFSGYLLAINNLNDLNNISTARNNLGLGSAALQSVTYFLQSSNNFSDLTNSSTARNNLGLGTIATQNANSISVTGGSLSGIALATSTISGSSFTTYTEQFVTANSTSSYVINLAAGNNFVLTLTVNCTFSFSNVPVSNESSITLIIKQDTTGGRTVTWPASIIWPNATAPTLTTTANSTDVIVMITTNGGTTWRGFTAGLKFSQ